MNQDQFDRHLQTCIERTQSILKTKASEYAHGDRLSNFKDMSTMKKETPEKALWGVCTKHIIALQDFIDELDSTQAPRPYSYWQEKTGDIINYMILLEALVLERVGNEESV